MSEWHIITCEYPPQIGGVSGYTKLVAEGLAEAGDEVHVWCPENRSQEAEGSGQKTEGRRHDARVTVHRELGNFRPSDLRRAGKHLDRFQNPRRLLVQWVPHGYGYCSMNLPFCFWLWRRGKLKGDRIELMVHEPFLVFGEGSLKQDLAAAVHRVMVILLLDATSRIWVSTQEWEGRLRPFLFGRQKPIAWLPVPSNIPVIDDPIGIAKTRAKYAANGTRLIGHFGAYDRYMCEIMSVLLPSLLNGKNDLSMLLLGKGSIEHREHLLNAYPQLSARIHATGEIPADEISKHLSACDLMLQPYQDGVSGRRTSVMSALQHGKPIVTTTGKATERCWVETQAVNVGNAGDVAAFRDLITGLLADESELRRAGMNTKALYDDCFTLNRIVTSLRSVFSEPGLSSFHQ